MTSMDGINKDSPRKGQVQRSWSSTRMDDVLVDFVRPSFVFKEV